MMIQTKPFSKADNNKKWVLTEFKEGKHVYRVLSPEKVNTRTRSRQYRFGIRIGEKYFWFNDGKYVVDTRKVAKQVFLNLRERFETEGSKSAVFMSKK